jgi:hypothetical protein
VVVEHGDGDRAVLTSRRSSGGAQPLAWAHTGFTGIGGFAMSKLFARVRRTMLAEGVPPVLAEHHALRSPPATR